MSGGPPPADEPARPSRLASVTYGMRPGGRATEVAASLLSGAGIADPDSALALRLARVLAAQPTALSAAVSEVLADPRVAEPLARRLLGALRSPPPAVDWLSLGTHCYTSTMLQRWGLRHWSGPFDWLFSSSGMIRHCLDDDFATFLDRRHYEPVPPEARHAGPAANRVQHAFYREHFKVEHVFNHHDVHLDEPYAYLQRCVARLREVLAAPGPKVFVLTSWHYIGFEGDMKDLRDTITQHTANFRLLAYGVQRGAPALGWPTLNIVLEDETLRLHEMRPGSAWRPLEFEAFVDEHCLVESMFSGAAPLAGPRA